MQIQITFKNLDPSDAVKTHATEKTEKLKKYFDGKIHVTWTFSTDKQDAIAHCHLLGNQMDYFGEANAEHHNLYLAIDDALSKIEKQIQRHKEKVTNHIHR